MRRLYEYREVQETLLFFSLVTSEAWDLTGFINNKGPKKKKKAVYGDSEVPTVAPSG